MGGGPGCRAAPQRLVSRQGGANSEAGGAQRARIWPPSIEDIATEDMNVVMAWVMANCADSYNALHR